MKSQLLISLIKASSGKCAEYHFPAAFFPKKKEQQHYRLRNQFYIKEFKKIFNQPILIIGAGSIGERHIRNCYQLGFTNILVYRQRNLPYRDIGNANVITFTQWSNVLEAAPTAAIICTPTIQHASQTIECLQNNMHILVEKPISHNSQYLQQIIALANQKNKLVQVGYMLRYHPLLQQAKKIISSNKFGKVLHIQTYWAEYLPHWHPWEDYRISYAAKKELGGGVALTYSHDIDVVLWWMEDVAKLVHHQSVKTQPSSLEINTDSVFNATLQFSNQTTAQVTCLMCQKIPQRWYKIIFENAVIDIDYFAATIHIQTETNKQTENIHQFDRNELFIQQTQHFFQQIAAGNYQAFTLQQINTSQQIINICANE